MASDGKGKRKLKKNLCPKCNDGLVSRFARSKGKVSGLVFVPCKHCKRGKERREYAQ
jgi:RNase P subunit RPR2